MGISLYDVTVLGFMQTVAAIDGVLQKGAAWSEAHGYDADKLLDERLHPDMLPLRFQANSVIKHSVGALECAKAGLFGRPPETPPYDYAQMRAAIAEAGEQLKTYTRDEIDALQGRELVFNPGGNKISFNVEDFLMSFSIPNLHFHATTAYDILRHKGVPLGKRDYLTRLRTRS
jgi:hypothetical protein